MNDSETTNGETIRGEFTVPGNSNLTSLLFLAKPKDSNLTSEYTFKNLEIRPSHQNASIDTPPVFVNNFEIFENLSPENQDMTVGRDALQTVIRQGISDNGFRDNIPQDTNIIGTEPFSVKPNTVYNYNLAVEAKNISSIHATAHHLTDDSVKKIQNDKSYGATNPGQVLVLKPESEIFTNLDILRSSNYTIAVKVKVCETCTFLRLGIGDKTQDISLASRIPKFQWMYYNTYLKEGEHKLKFYSDSNTGSDSVILYSTTADDMANDVLENVFVSKESPAQVVDYEKINPTKHLIKVNAKEPYIFSFAEAYDPLWAVYSDGVIANSIPLVLCRERFSDQQYRGT